MRKVTRRVGALADRLLGTIVPSTVARATDCDYECCNHWTRRRCCVYPDGHISCSACVISTGSGC